MKSFREYLMEDGRQFTYRIKIAGDVTAEQFDKIKTALDRYEVVDISDMKSTPIQETPAGFPGISNESVNIINFTFKYPAALREVQDLINHCTGIDMNRIVVLNAVWDDSNSEELGRIDDQLATSEDDSLLMTQDLGKPTAEQKELSKRYATRDAAMAKEAAKDGAKFTVAGGKTPKAKTTNDIPQSYVSPFTNVNKPASVRIGPAAIDVGNK